MERILLLQMNDWIVQREYGPPVEITEAARTNHGCGRSLWRQASHAPYHTAVQIAAARNTDVLGTQLQAGLATHVARQSIREGERLLAQQLTDLQESYSKLNDEVIELRGWKRAALQVESQWDEQAVGRALGFTLGCNIRPRILPAILELKQHLALCTTILQGVILIISKAGFPDTAKDIEGVLKRRNLI